MKKYIIYFVMAIAITSFGIAGCGSNSQETTSAPKNTMNQVAKTTEDTVSASLQSQPSLENQASAAKSEIMAQVPSGFKQFRVYSDDSSPDNHFFPSGWMGDFSDLNFDSASFDNPHSGTTCIKIYYSNKASQGARWSGIYWQNPPNNWGSRPGGYDLTGATKLTFWARGENGGERIEEFKMGGITGEYSDTDVQAIGPVKLTKEWKQYTIDLEGLDLTSIIGGFAWAANLDNNPDGLTMYLDDIRYE